MLFLRDTGVYLVRTYLKKVFWSKIRAGITAGSAYPFVERVINLPQLRPGNCLLCLEGHGMTISVKAYWID